MKLEGRVNTVAGRIKIDQNLDRLQRWYPKFPKLNPVRFCILEQPKEGKQLTALTDCELNAFQRVTDFAKRMTWVK